MISLSQTSFIRAILATTPLIIILYLMIGRSWGGSKAGPVGWLTAVTLSLLFFGAGFDLLVVAAGRSILLALFVLYIIWMALLLYHIVDSAGVITAIGQQMPGIAHDKPAQALLLSWIFGAFLQGATGFGVPAAIVAPLLMGLGFGADTAVVMALLGHAWAVTFGSLGSSFLSLMAATGLPGEMLADQAALFLAVCCLGCGLGVLWLVGGWPSLRRRGLFVLGLTAVMAGTQWAIAHLGLWTLAAFGGGLAGLIVAISYLSWRNGREATDSQPTVNTKRLITAFTPYYFLILIVVAGQLFLRDFLNIVQLNYDFPAVVTSLGWETPAGTGRSISLFGHAGALLLYTSVITFAYYRWRGLPDGMVGELNGRVIVQKTLRRAVKPTIGIFSLIAMALTMQHAGMTQTLAEQISRYAGSVFPFLSPFLGALGAFMTGSNTNSNVVFGQLQLETAVALNLSIPIILAAQTAGGAIGSLFAPAKVIVGCSTVPGADESRVLKLATLSGIIIIAVLGIVAFILR